MPGPEAVALIAVPGRDVLTEILRDGAQRLLGEAVEAEVDDWIERHAALKNERGHRLVVGNGHTAVNMLAPSLFAVEQAN